MLEIFQEAFRGINLPITIALGLILLYWVIAMLGMVDLDARDGFLGLDTDIDIDVDVDPQAIDAIDGETEVHSHEGHSANALECCSASAAARDISRCDGREISRYY